MNIEIKKADVADAEEILALQKLVFRAESNAYDHCAIPPLAQTLESITSKFRNKVFLKAVNDGKIIGSIRAFKEGETCYLEKLFIHPSFQGHGIGTKLMQRIEKYFVGKVKRIQLSTDNNNKHNVQLYQRLGYKAYKTDKVADNVTFIYMEKYLPIRR
ncbi:MAG: GNAT family N-acetyltransferase [Candidatus Omnitrophota bacterium]